MKLVDILLEMPPSDLQKAELAIDAMFRELGLDVQFTQHFKNRVLDNGSEARDTDVTGRELFKVFNALKIQYGDQLLKAKDNPKEFVAILKDASTNLNIPFVIDYNRVYRGLHKLTATTLMRKRNFVPNRDGGKILTVNTER